MALDLFVGGAQDWFSGHQFVTAIIAELILLGAVFFGIEYFVRQGEEARWREAAAEPLRVIAATAESFDWIIEQGTQEDGSLALDSTTHQQAREKFSEFSNLVNRYQPLLTASPFMAGFLPATIELEATAKWLLATIGGRRSNALHVEWYEKALRTFLAKYCEVVRISEFSHRWLYWVPLKLMYEQSEDAGEKEKSFLAAYIADRESGQGVSAPARPSTP